MISQYDLETSRVVVKRTRYGLMMFNRNDIIIGRSLDRYGEWTEGEMDLLRPVIRPGDLVLDIGANIGTHTLAFANLVGPTGAVVAFEPQPTVFNILAANLALNNADQVRAFNAAVGAGVGGAGGGLIQVPRTAPDRPANFGDLHLRWDAPGAATDAVPLMAIDALELQACKLIKVDVQGMEAEVLRCASATIARHRPILYVECEVVDQARELIGLILAGGYDIYWHLVPYFSHLNYYDNQDNVFAHLRPAQNLLCVPTEQKIPVSGLDPCRGEDDDCDQALQRVIGAQQRG